MYRSDFSSSSGPERVIFKASEVFQFLNGAVQGFPEFDKSAPAPLPYGMVVGLIKFLNAFWDRYPAEDSENLIADFYSDGMLGYNLSEHVAMHADVLMVEERNQPNSDLDDDLVLMKEFLHYQHRNASFMALGDITKRIESAVSSLAAVSRDAEELLRESTRSIASTTSYDCEMCRGFNPGSHDFLLERLILIQDFLESRS